MNTNQLYQSLSRSGFCQIGALTFCINVHLVRKPFRAFQDAL
ncbi:hypothetical protein CEV32_1111 [Brucella rhizosphaerae]|uniref:Uncharacterized protein n=1 Tax=Brucella rhizosphaerae TaxID=571254 RepID=A0A256FE48_9HYPH|nr:hypothetical protein CEV32_1111 [Brucella rhizosphaerae]